MSGPHQHAEPPSAVPGGGPAVPCRDGVTDLVRWAAFSVVLVPVVLLYYGTSFAGTAGTALGLAAVTCACRLLMRRSERVAGRAAGPNTGRPEGPGTGPERPFTGPDGAPGKHTGRLTGFRARVRIFSANFPGGSHPCPHHPRLPVPPARKGSRGPRAPYVDWPLRQGALPWGAPECNAS